MKVLVVNAGSSSLKYQLFDMDGEIMLAKGNCERIGADSIFSHTTNDGRKLEYKPEMANHSEAFDVVVKALTEGETAVISDMSEINAVGHRIVHGGEYFTHSVIVDDDVINKIEELAELAPLHNHAHVQGIRAAIKVMGKDVPQVVVFDTAFHQTMPPKAYMTGLNYEYYEKYHIRTYGFHGTSHRYVSQRAAVLLGRDIKELKLITCHLGNGSSITAVEGGKSIDTSMGFTPLGGLIMGTRSGSLDPSAVMHIMDKENIGPKEMLKILNKQSGYLGLTGISNDDRDIVAAIKRGDERAAMARAMLEYQIKKYIGSYIAAMNGVDAIVFTGGIGENCPDLREHVCTDMEFFGISMNIELNLSIRGKEAELSTPDSRVKVYCIPTNEEIVIARDTMDLTQKNGYLR